MYRNLNIVDAIMHKLDSYATDLEKKISERTRELEDEQMKSELLLYSMMPPWVSYWFVDSSLLHLHYTLYFCTYFEFLANVNVLRYVC